MVSRLAGNFLFLAAAAALFGCVEGKGAALPADTVSSGWAACSPELPREKYGSGGPGALDFYQRFISPVKGGNTCAMHPSCSQYAKIALERLGPLPGLAASCDRFVRCGRDRYHYQAVAADGAFRAYDPVENPAPGDSPTVFKGAVSGRDVGAPRIAADTPAAGDSAALDTGDAAQGQCCDFADFLMRRQSCQSAMLEYERVLYRETEPACKKKAALGLLKTSSIVNNLDGFVTTFHLSLNSAGRDREFSAACGMLLARRYYAAGRYGDALGALSAYVLSDSAGILDKRRLLAALCRLSVYRTDAAMAVADSISTESPLSKFTQTLRREKKRFEGPERSPLAAGMLSTVVPGAGYLYAGRPATALASLIVNGLFFWTTYDFFAGKHYAAATTSLVLGAGFYMGNIRGSIRAARATSAKDRRKKIALLLEGVPVDW